MGLLRADVGLPDFGGLPPAGSTSNSLMATAGLGLKINFGDSPWALRTEYRLRHAFDDDGLTDQIGSVGIQYSFGGASARAMAAPVSEPEPAAEPEPVVQPDPDSDGDGVVDARDACANTPRGVEVDASGCEVMAPIELSPVYFATESAVLDDLAKRTLDENVAILSEYPDLQVDITGHADSRGPEEYNMGLSQRRAESVRRYLEDAGVNPANLNALGFGESRPVASNETAAGQAKNRRVELEVLDR